MIGCTYVLSYGEKRKLAVIYCQYLFNARSAVNFTQILYNISPAEFYVQ